MSPSAIDAAGTIPIAVAIAVLSTSSAVAQTQRTDEQIWLSLSGTAPVGHGIEVKVDGLLQVVDDATRPGRELVRVVALKQVGPKMKVGGGYVWTQLQPTRGARTTEHRTLQEIDFQTPILGERATFSSRTQFEQRWREGIQGTSLRLRQRSHLQVPIDTRGTGIVAWNEYFHEFRGADWSGRSGPSLMLNFAGLHIPLANNVAIEPGYLNQTQFDPGPNRVRHAAALFAAFRLEW